MNNNTTQKKGILSIHRCIISMFTGAHISICCSVSSLIDGEHRRVEVGVKVVISWYRPWYWSHMYICTYMYSFSRIITTIQINSPSWKKKVCSPIRRNILKLLARLCVSFSKNSICRGAEHNSCIELRRESNKSEIKQKKKKKKSLLLIQLLSYSFFFFFSLSLF
jgi:hypothetical protein